MEEFRIIVYAVDYDLGTSVVVKNDTALMDVYRRVLSKLKIPVPDGKEPMFSTKSKWAFALGINVGDLDEIFDGDLLELSLWDLE